MGLMCIEMREQQGWCSTLVPFAALAIAQQHCIQYNGAILMISYCTEGSHRTDSRRVEHLSQDFFIISLLRVVHGDNVGPQSTFCPDFIPIVSVPTFNEYTVQ